MKNISITRRKLGAWLFLSFWFGIGTGLTIANLFQSYVINHFR